MNYTKDNALGFVMGCRAMLDAVIVAYHRGRTFKDAVGELAKWNDDVLNPWRAKVEDAEEGQRFCLCDFPIPGAKKRENTDGHIMEIIGGEPPGHFRPFNMKTGKIEDPDPWP